MTTSVLDDATTEAIRSALAEAAAGRLDEACRIGQAALDHGGDAPALHAMLGMLRSQAGELDDAIRHLSIAQQARPNDVRITNNLAVAMAKAGRTQDALELITEDLARVDSSFQLWRLRGYLAQELDDHAEAVRSYREVVAAAPTDWETWNNLGNAFLAAGQAEDAVDALERSVKLNPAAMRTRLNLGRAMRLQGRVADAERNYRAMAKDFPRDPEPLADLYGLLHENGFDLEAEDALRGALERDPHNIGMLVALGRLYLARYAMPQARTTFRKILLLEPSNGSAFLSLADVLEHEEPKGLPALLREAEAAGVDEVRLNLIRALIAQRNKDYPAGLRALSEVPEDFDPVRRWHLQGQLLDGSGDSDGAFEAYSRMNRALADEPTGPLSRAAQLREQLRDQFERTTPAWQKSWVAPPLEAERSAPVFLVGFPRSGTTLLDTMLMGHPDVEVMEERPVLSRLRTETGGFDALAAMDEAEVRRLQKRYFEIASEFTPLREGSLLVDKSPLHMLNVAQIYRLFPNARFVLALRHPADVVLSCFIAKFRMNNSMANFVDLPTVAEFYDLSFRMWEQARELLPIEVHPLVYERMIDNPEGALRPLVESLGLRWKPEMLEHQRTAEARGVITTASYAQVTQPLYTSAAGRWKRYRKHLEPVLPTLRPWVEKFGYEL